MVSLQPSTRWAIATIGTLSMITTLPLWLEIVGEVLARNPACLGMVDSEVDRRALGAGVDADNRTPAAIAFFTDGSIASESAGLRKMISVPAATKVSTAVTSLLRS